jgi:hypothetical protein
MCQVQNNNVIGVDTTLATLAHVADDSAPHFVTEFAAIRLLQPTRRTEQLYDGSAMSLVSVRDTETIMTGLIYACQYILCENQTQSIMTKIVNAIIDTEKREGREIYASMEPQERMILLTAELSPVLPQVPADVWEGILKL